MWRYRNVWEGFGLSLEMLSTGLDWTTMHPVACSAIDRDDGRLGREVLMLNGRPGYEK